MDNIKFSLFDVFAYAIPGAVALLTSIILFNQNIQQLSDLGLVFQNMSIGSGLVAIVASYIIGFALDSPASWIYYNVGCRIWGQPYSKSRTFIKPSVARALVRHYSAENWSYIQTWKVLKTMSHNLAFAMMLLFSVSIVQAARSAQHLDQWVILAIISILSGTIFLNRASIFDKWHYNDLSETVKSLHLVKRATKDIKDENNLNQNEDLLETLLEAKETRGI